MVYSDLLSATVPLEFKARGSWSYHNPSLSFHHICYSSTLSDLIKSNMKGGMAHLAEILFLATSVLLGVDDAGSVTNPSALWTVVAKRY